MKSVKRKDGRRNVKWKYMAKRRDGMSTCWLVSGGGMAKKENAEKQWKKARRRSPRPAVAVQASSEMAAETKERKHLRNRENGYRSMPLSTYPLAVAWRSENIRQKTAADWKRASGKTRNARRAGSLRRSWQRAAAGINAKYNEETANGSEAVHQ